MENIEVKMIKIDDIQQDAKRITVKDGEVKYSFWLTKKDGSDTRAYQSWMELSPRVGDHVDIQFKAEEATFTNPSGKEVTFTRRTILNVRRPDGTAPRVAPRVTDEPKVEYVTKDEFEAKIKEMSEAFMKMAVHIQSVKKHVGMED